MRNKDLSPKEQAHSYAFLLLKFRLRSEKELFERLKRKKFSPEVIAETISFLKEKGFIDDKVFARAWIESRLKKPYGMRRLAQELKAKGIAAEIIDSWAREIKKSYSEEEVVSRLAREKFKKLKSVEPQKAKQRIYGFLLRRGFSPDAVIDVIRGL